MGFSLPAGGERGDLQHFPAITRHGVWDRRQNIGFLFYYFFIFFSPSQNKSNIFSFCSEAAAGLGSLWLWGEQPSPTEELRRKLCAPIAAFSPRLPWCHKSRGGRGMVKAGEDQKLLFPCLGNVLPCPGHHLSVKETKIPAESSWHRRLQGRAWSRVAMAALKHGHKNKISNGMNSVRAWFERTEARQLRGGAETRTPNCSRARGAVWDAGAVFPVGIAASPALT